MNGYWSRAHGIDPSHLAGASLSHSLSSALDKLRRVAAGLRGRVGHLAHRVGRIGPDQLFLAGFAILFLLFFLILLVQPSAVGRGGR